MSLKKQTSKELINRINYDEELQPSSEWIVGYLDRFFGIIEKPFDDFDFKTDISSVDINQYQRKFGKKIIPIHRIYYFKRNNEIIWDRSYVL